MHRNQPKTVAFLRKAAPLVAEGVAVDKRRLREAEVLRIAKSCNVPLLSFVVAAVLSCLYDSAKGVPSHRVYRPGREVIKPRLDYTERKFFHSFASVCSCAA
jgi:hypothetical protein